MVLQSSLKTVFRNLWLWLVLPTNWPLLARMPQIVTYMATFRDHLQDLYLFFNNSDNRTATLKAASLTLSVTDLKVRSAAV